VNGLPVVAGVGILLPKTPGTGASTASRSAGMTNVERRMSNDEVKTQDGERTLRHSAFIIGLSTFIILSHPRRASPLVSPESLA